MNPWHDLRQDRFSKESFLAVIEISKGSKKKYELDKESGMLILDRILYTSTHYPANYGFIPRTYSDDGDPLDVLVICQESLDPLTIVRCYPIGVIKMEVVRIIVTVVFIIVGIALAGIVLMQEGKSAGLGTISGAAESYWGKNKGRSMEGVLVKTTRWLAVAFMVLAILLNMSFF
jgi:protein translocase SecG subunit